MGMARHAFTVGVSGDCAQGLWNEDRTVDVRFFLGTEATARLGVDHVRAREAAGMFCGKGVLVSRDSLRAALAHLDHEPGGSDPAGAAPALLTAVPGSNGHNGGTDAQGNGAT